MTESAKQDTTKTPAEPAATESTATTGEATQETAAEPEETAEAAAGEHAKPDLDETKRKFREALERKHGTHASAEAVDHTGKVHGSHGPAASRRSFRRKSGG